MAVLAPQGINFSASEYDLAFGLDYLFPAAHVELLGPGWRLVAGGVSGPTYTDDDWQATFVVDGQTAATVSGLCTLQPDLDTYASQKYGGCVVSRVLSHDASLTVTEVTGVSTTLLQSERTAWHEAGHAVAAVVTGWGLCSVSISDPNSPTGGRVYRPGPSFDMSQPPFTAARQSFVRADIVGTLAGPHAACQRAGIPYFFYPEPDRTGSLMKAYLLDGAGGQQLYHDAEAAADGFVQGCWEAIDAVAQELVARDPIALFDADVLSIVEAHGPLEDLRKRVRRRWRVV